MCHQAENSSIQLLIRGALIGAFFLSFIPGASSQDAPQSPEEKVGEAFESLMLQRLLTQMRSSSQVFSDEEDNPFRASNAERIFQSMQDQELAKSLARQNPIGIKQIVVRQLTGKSGVSNRVLVE